MTTRTAARSKIAGASWDIGETDRRGLCRRPRRRTGVSFLFSPPGAPRSSHSFPPPPINQLFLSRRVLFLRPCLLCPRAVHMFLIGRLVSCLLAAPSNLSAFRRSLHLLVPVTSIFVPPAQSVRSTPRTASLYFSVSALHNYIPKSACLALAF